MKTLAVISAAFEQRLPTIDRTELHRQHCNL